MSYYSHSNNIYYSSSGPSETGGLTTNPMFTDVAANNYTLQASSPAINSGANLGYTQDFIGAAIPASAPDRGAYEYNGSTTTTAPAAPTNVRVVR